MIVWGGGANNVGLPKYWRQIQSKHRQLGLRLRTVRLLSGFSHTAVWTGTEMIVWGGGTNTTSLNTGGRYNPSTDSWTATTTTNAAQGAPGSHRGVDWQLK